MKLRIASDDRDHAIERLRIALEFYADRVNYRSNWIFAENVLADRGDIARKALGACTCGGDTDQPASHHDISCPSSACSTEAGYCEHGERAYCTICDMWASLPPSERGAHD